MPRAIAVPIPDESDSDAPAATPLAATVTPTLADVDYSAVWAAITSLTLLQAIGLAAAWLARIAAEAALSMTKKILALDPPAGGDSAAWAAYLNILRKRSSE